MEIPKYARRLAAAVCLSMAGIANATPISVSTGDLGNNVIGQAGSFAVSLSASAPSNVQPASIDVKYGLWNSPDVQVSVFFNSTLVGSFLADQGYIAPGPEFASFDVTGLLLEGANAILFDGFGANGGAYVVGQVTLNYDGARTNGIPEAGTLALLAAGLAGLGIAKRRRKS